MLTNHALSLLCYHRIHYLLSQQLQEEKQLKAQDVKKLKKMMKANLPQQIMAVNKLNDPISIRKRVTMSLPEPRVSDAELDDIVKLGAAAAAASGSNGQSSSDSTAGLLGEYNSRSVGSSATPLRTPATAAGTDIIMQEARNMIALTAGQTPLFGGENPELEEGTGFEGSTPKRQKVTATPSSLSLATPGGATPMTATPGSVRNGGRSSSASGGDSMDYTPVGRTPLRDQLGLNTGDDFGLTPSGSTSSRIEKEIAKRAAAELAAKLAG
jgi:pre-mRNA-splicing factor CDC5/CEF1